MTKRKKAEVDTRRVSDDEFLAQLERQLNAMLPPSMRPRARQPRKRKPVKQQEQGRLGDLDDIPF